MVLIVVEFVTEVEQPRRLLGRHCGAVPSQKETLDTLQHRQRVVNG